MPITRYVGESYPENYHHLLNQRRAEGLMTSLLKVKSIENGTGKSLISRLWKSTLVLVRNET